MYSVSPCVHKFYESIQIERYERMKLKVQKLIDKDDDDESEQIQ